MADNYIIITYVALFIAIIYKLENFGSRLDRLLAFYCSVEHSVKTICFLIVTQCFLLNYACGNGGPSKKEHPVLIKWDRKISQCEGLH